MLVAHTMKEFVFISERYANYDHAWINIFGDDFCSIFIRDFDNLENNNGIYNWNEWCSINCFFIWLTTDGQFEIIFRNGNLILLIFNDLFIDFNLAKQTHKKTIKTCWQQKMREVNQIFTLNQSIRIEHFILWACCGRIFFLLFLNKCSAKTR